jgi:hypothetical protein
MQQLIFKNICWKRWPLGCLFFLLAACKQYVAPDYSAQYASIHQAAQLAHNGDLVFRNGTDDVSAAARSMNEKDTSYSHCGLIMIENDSVYVYHAIGGHYNPDQTLKREPLDSFCNPADNDRFGIFRYEMDSLETGKLERIVHGYYAAGLRFDLFFNFFSDDEMYCSEFVYKSLNKALNGRLRFLIRRDKWPYGVSLDDLFLHPGAKVVKQVRF